MSPESAPAPTGLLDPVACPTCGEAERSLVYPVVSDVLMGHPGSFRIQQCSACRVRYVEPRPVGETLAGFYESADGEQYYTRKVARAEQIPCPSPAERWVLHSERGYPQPAGPRPSALTLWRARRSLASDPYQMRYLPWSGDGRILDVGAGSGWFVAAMKDLGWQPTASDLFPQVCQQIQDTFGVPAVAGDLLSADLPAGHFDTVTLWHVLEHLTNPNEIVERCKDLLRPGGTLAIGVPVYDSIIEQWMGPLWLGYDVPRHIFAFDRRGLTAFLERHGLQVVSLASEMGDFTLRKGVKRLGVDVGWWRKQVISHGLTRIPYARWLARHDLNDKVVVLATKPG